MKCFQLSQFYQRVSLKFIREGSLSHAWVGIFFVRSGDAYSSPRRLAVLLAIVSSSMALAALIIGPLAITAIGPVGQIPIFRFLFFFFFYQCRDLGGSQLDSQPGRSLTCICLSRIKSRGGAKRSVSYSTFHLFLHLSQSFS